MDSARSDMTVKEFLTKLEQFLQETLEEKARGNVFLSQDKENGPIAVNVLIGAPFEDADDDLTQVNVIIAATDRSVLGSQGVSMNDGEMIDEDVDLEEAFQAAQEQL